MGFSTDAIHFGQEHDPATGAVIAPIHLTSIFAQKELGEGQGYQYSRTGNPTRAALEKCLARLEGGAHGFAFSSGVAAIHAAMTLLKTGDHVVAGQNLYGGTIRLFEGVMKDWGLEITYADTTKLDRVESAFRPSTRMLYVETPSNPMMEITDLTACAELAHRHKALMAVDNTFMTPYLQRPGEFGADIVIHSTTKYLNGHSDGIGGAVVLDDADLAARLEMIQSWVGAVLSPFDSWLVLRSVKTLPVRMREHNKNAAAVADFLKGHSKVGEVFYPGFSANPGYDLAKKQMSGFGGMVSFETGSLENARKLTRALRLCTFSGSLGGVESIVSHPVTMSHSSLTPAQRERSGLTEGLLRISVGLEDVEDIIADLDDALVKM